MRLAALGLGGSLASYQLEAYIKQPLLVKHFIIEKSLLTAHLRKAHPAT